MNSPRYHPTYVTIRRNMHSSSYGFLPNLTGVTALLDLAQSTPHDSFLVDAGDALTHAAHSRVRRSQHLDDYSRERLRVPASTYADERTKLTAGWKPDDSDQPPFVELVLAGDSDLAIWASTCDEYAETWDDPNGVHCHTPLNQRLLRPNLQLCEWLVRSLADARENSLNDSTHEYVLLAGSVFIGICRALDLSDTERGRLASFGHRYLARYLEWDNQSPHHVRERRAQRIHQTAERFNFGHAQSGLDPGWLESATHAEPWFFFPESVWMQYHWFAQSLPLPLSRELALTEALLTWSL